MLPKRKAGSSLFFYKVEARGGIALRSARLVHGLGDSHGRLLLPAVGRRFREVPAVGALQVGQADAVSQLTLVIIRVAPRSPEREYRERCFLILATLTDGLVRFHARKTRSVWVRKAVLLDAVWLTVKLRKQCFLKL